MKVIITGGGGFLGSRLCDQLLERVWEADFVGDPRTVDLHVRRLRAQIEDDPGAPRFLQTVWGIGYRMAEEPEA